MYLQYRWLLCCIHLAELPLAASCEEELEIKIFIHEYNRTEWSNWGDYKIMAYWTRPAFAVVKPDGSTASCLTVDFCLNLVDPDGASSVP